MGNLETNMEPISRGAIKRNRLLIRKAVFRLNTKNGQMRKISEITNSPIFLDILSLKVDPIKTKRRLGIREILTSIKDAIISILLSFIIFKSFLAFCIFISRYYLQFYY